MNKSSDTSETSVKHGCFDCEYHRIGGVTFLGICGYFYSKLKKRNKAIPPSIVYIGCKFFAPKQMSLFTEGNKVANLRND